MRPRERRSNGSVTPMQGLAPRRPARHSRRRDLVSRGGAPMQRSHSVPVLLALPVLVLGCATSRPFDRSTEPGGRPLSPTTAGSVIITGDALSADPGRTVLDAVKKAMPVRPGSADRDRKSTRLNSSHSSISYAVFCLKKKKKKNNTDDPDA